VLIKWLAWHLSVHTSIHPSVNVTVRPIADLSPSNAFKLPIFEISILEDEKSSRALAQIVSPGGARGVYLVLSTVKKWPDDIIEKSANRTANSQKGTMFFLVTNSVTIFGLSK
jgi:hypothetical protein